LLTKGTTLNTEKTFDMADGQVLETSGWIIDLGGVGNFDDSVDCQEEVNKDVNNHRIRLIPSVVRDGNKVHMTASCTVTKAEGSLMSPPSISTSVQNVDLHTVTYSGPEQSPGGYSIIQFTSHNIDDLWVKNHQTLAFNITISFE